MIYKLYMIVNKVKNALYSEYCLHHNYARTVKVMHYNIALLPKK